MKARKVWIGDMCATGSACVDKQPHKNCKGMCQAGRWLSEADYRALAKRKRDEQAVIRAAVNLKLEMLYGQGSGPNNTLVEALAKLKEGE
jgi:hypothetical protein